jgi:hypothetical protein
VLSRTLASLGARVAVAEDGSAAVTVYKAAFCKKPFHLVYCVLFAVCCLLSAVCYVLFAVCCLLSAVCCLLSAV